VVKRGRTSSPGPLFQRAEKLEDCLSWEVGHGREGVGVVEEVMRRTLLLGQEMMWLSARTGCPGCHLHDNAVGVEVGGGLGNLGLGGGGRHVE
jgi:hypothetical protein